jgi:hypothetical protein
MVLQERYVAEGGDFQAQKRCRSKLLSTAPKSHAHLVSNPIETRGHPLVVKPHPDPKEKLVNEQGLVVETLTHSINENMEGLAVEIELSARGTTRDKFFLQVHADLSFRLT